MRIAAGERFDGRDGEIKIKLMCTRSWVNCWVSGLSWRLI
jgi:hypothetical protein